jgi:glycine hydroxymethyltransferase
MSVLSAYLEKQGNSANTETVAYLAQLEMVAKVDPEIARSVVAELRDQRSRLKMIASENYSSISTQLAMGNLLTDKYAEGYPHHRFYAGCDNVDAIESKAVQAAKDLFGAEHAYVQAHSGADANMLAFSAILSKEVQEPALEKLGVTDPSKLSDADWAKVRAELGNKKLIGLNYYSGGHLTHGYRHNISARMFECLTYDVEPETEILDYDKLRELVLREKPLIFLAGYSAYPRKINFRILKEIADEAGSVFMVDMAHFAGLVAGKVFTDDFDPVAHADIVTSTTHKTLRGPRGGLVLCKQAYAEWVDKGCPLVLGGPLPHVMAAKAIAFQEANSDEFKVYAQQVVDNAKALAKGLMDAGIRLTSGGTDNHLLVADITSFKLTGRQAESALREANITLNRNSIPFDPNGAWYTSGLRFGAPALTTLGMGVDEMKEVASIISLILSNTTANTIESGKNAGQLSKAKYTTAPEALSEAKKRVAVLLERYVLYPELDLEILEKI